MVWALHRLHSVQGRAPRFAGWSEKSIARYRELNLAFAMRIWAPSAETYDLLAKPDSSPDAINPAAVPSTDEGERDIAKWDRQARDSTGKYTKSRRRK